MTDQAKRSVPRAPIEIRVEYEHLNALIADYTKNLSKGGAFIETTSPLPVGTKCYFTLEVPSLPSPLTLEGRVKHHQEGEGKEGMGIEFLFSGEDELQAFHTVLDKLMFEHLGDVLFKKLKNSH